VIWIDGGLCKVVSSLFNVLVLLRKPNEDLILLVMRCVSISKAMESEITNLTFGISVYIVLPVCVSSKGIISLMMGK